MILTPMRYKGYTWPHNPRVYTIDYGRTMVANKVPNGLYHLQDLDRTQRVMRGEGEFVGKKAYAQFGQLANVFYQGGSGMLIHPLWQASDAYFVSLKLEMEPRPDYVRYSFEFWETSGRYTGMPKKVASTAVTDSGQGTATVSTSRYHRVARGDTLWSIAKQYGVDFAALIGLNPQIKNPNLIYVGNEVRVA